MKPAPFRYCAPASVGEAVALKAEHGSDAVFLAGGQSLVPMLNLRLVRPALVIDLNRIAGLSEIAEGPEGLTVGAMTRHHALERSDLAFRICPLLREVLGHVAHRVIRNRGTIAGSLANAHPASELPAALLALGGAVIARSPAGSRRIEADDLFLYPFSTSLGADELVTEVIFPALPAGTGYGFAEFTRRHSDFALAGVAAVVRDGSARLALAGVGPRPILVDRPEPADIAAAAEPGDDIHADAEYRRELVVALAVKALGLARSRAEAAR
ncbi:FAD binding domain-containing protein [Enterovirga sp. CN4-39]|uniref:FAD binding domain-containing protein n=1 Tax=Enterovirga sp. CN4-39 TaxID=3400910 RepID=UPI003C0ABEA9